MSSASESARSSDSKGVSASTPAAEIARAGSRTPIAAEALDYARLFQEGPLAASIVSRDDGRVLEVNRMFEELTGYDRDTIVGRRVADFGLFIGADVDTTPPDTHPGGPGDEAVGQFETSIRTRTGERRDVIVRAAAIDFGGRPCLLSQLSDTTDRRRMERKILRAADDEQRRIGLDLHEGLGAHLTGISLLVRGLARNARRNQSVEPEKMDEIARLLSEGIETVRTLAQELHPFILAVRGLTVALSDLAATTEALGGIACAFEEEGDGITPTDEQSMHIYRIAHEAVALAVRHGQASHIQITLSRGERSGRITVADDGIGREPGRPTNGNPAKTGLDIMRHRARMIGARLEIFGSPGHGTTVACTFDLPTSH